MRVENQDRDLALPELEGTSKEEVHRRSKTVYTREFLLSCAELDDCKNFPRGFDPSVLRPSKTTYTKEFLLSCAELEVSQQLPEGFDSSTLRELKDGTRGVLEPWEGSGILLLPNSGDTRYRAQFASLDSSGSFRESDRRRDCLSLRWSRENNSQGNYDSDFQRNDLTQCLVEFFEGKAGDMGKRIQDQEAEKIDYYQLSKSENPYRPPHTYQDRRTKYEGKSLSAKTIAKEEEYSIEEETQLDRNIVAPEEHHGIKDTTFLSGNIPKSPISYAKPSSLDVKFLGPKVTTDTWITQFDTKKPSRGPNSDENLDEEKCSMIIKEDVARSLKVHSGASSTVIKKAAPKHLAVQSECQTGLSGITCFPLTDDSFVVLKNSTDGTYCHMNQSQKPRSEMEFNKFFGNRGFYFTGSFNRITSDEVSESYEFPFPFAYDLFSSVLCEDNPIKPNHQSFITADAADEFEFYNMEENECTYDDMWSEILEILRFEQEMELKSAAESDQTDDFIIHVSFPDEMSLISVDNPRSFEDSKLELLQRANNIADYDAEICLPDENSIVTIEDLIVDGNRLISYDYPLISYDDPRSAELSKCVPLNNGGDAAEIHLPDEDCLITIYDLISPNHVRIKVTGGPAKDDTRKNQDVTQPQDLVITDPAKGTASKGEVSPALDVTMSIANQELRLLHSSLHNPCADIHTKTPLCYPLNSLEHQMTLPTTFMDPVAVFLCPALHCYSCPKMVHQCPGRTASPKTKEFSNPLSQYSLLQQPTAPQRSHLPAKDVACSNLDMEEMPLFETRHRQAAYPDLAIADPDFDHETGLNKFMDGKAGKLI